MKLLSAPKWGGYKLGKSSLKRVTPEETAATAVTSKHSAVSSQTPPRSPITTSKAKGGRQEAPREVLEDVVDSDHDHRPGLERQESAEVLLFQEIRSQHSRHGSRIGTHGNRQTLRHLSHRSASGEGGGDVVGKRASDVSTVSNCSRRTAVECIADHVRSHTREHPTLKAGVLLTKKNMQINLIVVRSKFWQHGDEDGAAGKPGIVMAVDEAAETASVYWYSTGEVFTHYAIGRRSELCKPKGHIPMGGVVDGVAQPSITHSAIEAMKVVFGRQKRASAEQRRNSQLRYADPSQTVIIFDWDDTLFPTTYIRHDLGLSVRQRLVDQKLPPDTMAHVKSTLAKSAGNVDALLRLADQNGKVIIVTLAREPWVTDSCAYFYPGIGELIDKLGIKIIYAQEGQQVEYNKVNMMAEEEFETFWASMKGRAIARALGDFYSQYDGQTWKNIISLGDSDFERFGAMAATLDYAREQGLVKDEDIFPQTKLKAIARTPKNRRMSNGSVGSAHSMFSVQSVKSQLTKGTRRLSLEGTVNGKEFKVRTKTFKMLDEPTVEELMVELSLIQQWLPLMVRLNDGFDVDLNSLDDNAQIESIENTLQAARPV